MPDIFIYTVLTEERHIDTDVDPFLDIAKAIAYAKAQVALFDKWGDATEYDSPEPSHVFSMTWGGENWVTVIKKKLNL